MGQDLSTFPCQSQDIGSKATTLRRTVLDVGDVGKLETQTVPSFNRPHALEQSLLKTTGHSDPLKSLIEDSLFVLLRLGPSERQLGHGSLPSKTNAALRESGL